MKTFIKNVKRIFKKKGIDYAILISVLILIFFGIAMIGSASIGSVGNVIRDSAGEPLKDAAGNIRTVSANYPLKNMIMQATFAGIGLVLMFLLAVFFRVKFLTQHSTMTIYVIGLVSMFVCLAWTTKGAHAWIRLGSITIQPAEFMKVAMVLILSYMFSDRNTSMKMMHPSPTKEMRELFFKKRLYESLFKPFLMIAIVFITCGFIQNDLGTALILFAVCAVCFLVAPARFYKKIQKIAFIGGVAFVLFMSTLGMSMLQGHQIERFQIWQEPLNDPYNASFQLVNSMIAITNGGLFGKGFGNSVQKFDYIPESHNDFIGAIAYEELGILGLALIIVPTSIIIFRLLYYADKIPDARSKIILCGVATYFMMHIFINLGGISGLIPMTGVPILLVSYGGSSTWSALISIGISQSIISKYNISTIQEVR